MTAKVLMYLVRTKIEKNFRNYFTELFSSTMPFGDDIQALVVNLTKKLTQEAKGVLSKDFTSEEV